MNKDEELLNLFAGLAMVGISIRGVYLNDLIVENIKRLKP